MRRWMGAALVFSFFGPCGAFSQTFGPLAPETRLLVPGSWTFAADSAYDPSVAASPDPWSSLPSLVSRLPEWDLVTRNGMSRGGCGLLFDGIACPLPGLAASLPAGGADAVERLGFPAGAWWGPAAGGGVLQWRPPVGSGKETQTWGTSAWVSGRDGGLGGQWMGNESGFRAAWDRRDNFARGWENAPSASGTLQKTWRSGWNLGASALHAGWGGEAWDVVDGSLGWNDGRFQDVKISPYAQQAHWNGWTSREAGTRFDHHVSFAGILETQWGVGGAARSWEKDGRDGSGRLGYARGGVYADPLGFAEMDLGGRVDGAQGCAPQASYTAGVRVPWNFLAVQGALSQSSNTGEAPSQPLGDALSREGSVGLSVVDTRSVGASVRFIRRRGENLRLEAWEPRLAWEGPIPRGWLARSLRLDFSGIHPTLWNGEGTGDRLFGRWTVGFPGGWSFLTGARWADAQRGGYEAGLRLERGKYRVECVWEGLGAEDAWKDPVLRSGRNLRISWEGAF